MVTKFYKNLMMIFALGMLWWVLTCGIAKVLGPTTANATVLTGAKRLSKRMLEDEWRKVVGRGIVKERKDKGREENRRVLEMIHGNRRRRRGNRKD